MGIEEIGEYEEVRRQNSSKRYAYTSNRSVMYSISMDLYTKYITFTYINMLHLHIKYLTHVHCTDTFFEYAIGTP